MARRSHYSFNKRQKEIRQKEKAEKKMQRRLLKKQRAAGELGEEPSDGNGVSEAAEATTVEAVEVEAVEVEAVEVEAVVESDDAPRRDEDS